MSKERLALKGATPIPTEEFLVQRGGFHISRDEIKESKNL